MTTLTLVETGRPKRDFVEMALEECGLAGYVFEHTPEEIASTLRLLDVMMYEWPWDQLGYNFTSYGAGLPEELSGIPDDAVQAVVLHLALRRAPRMGATLSPESRVALTMSKSLVTAKYGGGPPTMPLAPNTIRGAGIRRMEPFINETPEE